MAGRFVSRRLTSHLPRNDHKTLIVIMRIGVLTAGGDCPGLNAVIRAIVRCASADHVEVLGFRNGSLGLFENDFEPLTRAGVTGILPRGGTILGTSRFNPTKDEPSIPRMKEHWQLHRLSGLVVVGGGNGAWGAGWGVAGVEPGG